IGNDGLRLAALTSVTVGVIVWFSRDTIIHAYSPDPAVIAAAIPLFAFISFYQLFDSIQVTAAFILRAYMIAIVPTVIYALALWGVGLGGGYLLGFNLTGLTPPALQGASGFWFSNSVSIALVACGLFWYLRRIQHRLE
ncbi:MAG: MATE family efflux transporter, partial [Herbaspirillum sp.]